MCWPGSSCCCCSGRARCSRRHDAHRAYRRWKRRARSDEGGPMFAYYLDLALRSLKRNKVLTALMVLAIAVGIGASMTTLTVLHVLSGDPLPGKSGELYYPQLDPQDARGMMPGDRKSTRLNSSHH